MKLRLYTSLSKDTLNTAKMITDGLHSTALFLQEVYGVVSLFVQLESILELTQDLLRNCNDWNILY